MGEELKLKIITFIHKVLQMHIACTGVVLVCIMLMACVEEEKYPTPPGARLEFSVDTLRMDTVISGINSIKRTFTIYNPNKEGISITDVSFADGKTDGFCVNVDGITIDGPLPATIDCRGKDTLQVVAQIHPEESGLDEKQLKECDVVFTLANGERQSVHLEAYAQDVIWLRAWHVTGTETLSASRPYLIKDSLTIEKGGVLRIEPGVRLFFQSNAFLKIEGTLLAEGTRENPIVMRGERMDYMFENQPYDRISSQWQGILVGEQSYGNKMNWCDVHSGVYGIQLSNADIEKEKLKMENSILHNMSDNCLTATNCKIWVGNCQISNAGNNCVCLYGGDAEFVHCTIAQFYPFSFGDVALYFSNTFQGDYCPLKKAHFKNCLITGYSDDEIVGELGERYVGGEFNYLFDYCMLNTPDSKDDNIISPVWDKKSNPVSKIGNFPNIKTDWLYYDFSLDSASVAIGAGDVEITRRYYPEDRRGKLRLTKGKSDVGCYELE